MIHRSPPKPLYDRRHIRLRCLFSSMVHFLNAAWSSPAWILILQILGAISLWPSLFDPFCAVDRATWNSSRDMCASLRFHTCGVEPSPNPKRFPISDLLATLSLRRQSKRVEFVTACASFRPPYHSPSTVRALRELTVPKAEMPIINSNKRRPSALFV
jgi:hypothetical protein